MKNLRTSVLFASALLAMPALFGCGSEDETATEPAASGDSQGQRVEIEVGASGYDPAEVQATAGQPLTLVFTRVTDEGCGEELAIPSQDIRRDLPLNEAVEVTFTPSETGDLRFTCGMDMYDGTVVVR